MWRPTLIMVTLSCVLPASALAQEVITAEGPAPSATPGWDLAAEGQLALSLQRLGTGRLYNRAGPVASLRSPRWGPFRDVTAQLAVLFYTHERYLTGWPYVALALSAATPNFLR